MVNDPPALRDALPKQNASGTCCPGNDDESKQSVSPRELLVPENVALACSPKKPMKYPPVHAFVPLLTVVEEHCPDVQLMVMARLQACWA
jgi:hypothetical protein